MERITVLIVISRCICMYSAETVLREYEKNLLRSDTSCVEAVFTVTERSASQCAKRCMLDMNCCGFSYTGISKQCTGCPNVFSSISQPGSSLFYQKEGLESSNVYTYNGHSYKFVTNTFTNRDHARIQCASECGHLVIIETAQEEVFLSGIITQLSATLPDTEFWIGATQVSNTIYTWDNGLSFGETYEAFCSYEPKGNGDCVVMGFSQNYCWDDQPCSNMRQYICEFE